MSQNIIILPVEGLDRAVSPAALEAALLRNAGVQSVSMNVSAGRIRIGFDPEELGLRDLAAIVCAAGCGLCVSETVVRVRNIEHPWRCPEAVEVLRKVPGVVDAVWDRSTECVVVAYLPGRVRSRELVGAILKAGYLLAADPVVVSEVPAVRVAPSRRTAAPVAGIPVR